MSQSSPSALAPFTPSYTYKPTHLSLIAENDIALKNFRKRGLYKANSKAKVSYLQALCAVAEPSQRNLKVLKQVLHKNLRKADLLFYSLFRSNASFLGHYIPQLSHLNRLKITLRTDEETDDYLVSTMSKSVSKIKTLRSVDIELLDSNSITNKGIKGVFQKISYISNLKSFGFQIYECETLNSDNFTESVQYLTRLQSLKTLKLDLTNCYQLEDEALTYFARIFPRLDTLNQLKLKLKGCYNLTNTGLTALSSSLHSLSQLRSLEVNMDACMEITEEGVGQFIRDIGTLKELVSLKIGFSDGPETSNQAFETLGETLLSLTRLKEFEISLGSWHTRSKVCDIGISRFGELIAELRGLRSLKMRLWGFKEFSDEGVEELCGLLGGMQLEKLMLQFGRCKGITQRGIGQVEKKIAGSKRIPMVEIKCT